ncbi:DEAD/DEAH box helicase [Gracilibacillus sp. HCP3S3_G5_1]|uniref:DEAD/DEAH box helicase n=1 Tax=unclassified Gracilibacillus TaxID=2625209 RepID=UPI003F8C750A
MHKQYIDKLLKYDLETFAVQTGLKKSTNIKFTAEDAVKLLNLAENMSRNITNDDMRNNCLMICGLIWEHRQESWKALPTFLMKILTRIGLASSAKMLDSEFDINEDTFSDRGSILDEFYLSSEFMKSEVRVRNKKVLLSSFQKSMWDGIDLYSRFGISAPTSAGKSFVLVQKIIDLLDKGANKIVYVVPTISLIGQVTRDLLKLIKEHEISDVHIYQTISENNFRKNTINKAVYVLTQERASAVIKFEQEMTIDLLIIDEVQNIERAAHENDERSQILYELIQDFHLNINPKKIVISGPRIEKINELVISLFGKEAKGISDEVPPILNFTYSFIKYSGKLYMRLYNGLDSNSVTTLLDSTSDFDIDFFGKKVYTKKITDFTSFLVNNISSEDTGTIIFAPTSNSASKIAGEITTKNKNKNGKIDSLKAYIMDTVHENYSLIDCIDNGIAYHHGKMPIHIRIAVEQAFKKLVINKVVCTTTLMQGVNLPAKNIIARNPNLFINARSEGNNPKLTGYEFANLRGRAGRLMNDFVGRSIVLDEPAFEEAQIDLFEHPKKEVIGGYADRFEKNKADIFEELTEDTTQTDLNDFNNFDIVVYVRQMVLKYGEHAKDRLKRTGVNLTTNQIKKIHQKLKEITIPKELYISNRYWDPYVLQKIYNERKSMDVPSSPFDMNYVTKMLSLINRIKEITPYYYDKYFGVYESNRIFARVKAAQQWSQEIPLKLIIDEKPLALH